MQGKVFTASRDNVMDAMELMVSEQKTTRTAMKKSIQELERRSSSPLSKVR